MTFAQIKSFYLAAILGTFGRAAERLNTTQPAISARISALERELGVNLFDRAGHRVALTPNGRSFLKSAEKLLQIEAEALAGFGRGELSGVLRIGAADTMAITWIPDFLAELRVSYPDVSIEMHIGPSFRLREELLTRQVDVGFMVGPVSDADMVNHLLCDCRMVLAAAPALRLHGRRLKSSDLAAFDVYTFERSTRPYQDLTRELRRQDIQLKLSPISSLQMIVLLVVKGLGVGAVPLSVIEQEVATGDLVVLETDLVLGDIRFTASYPQGPDMHARETLVRLAMSFLKSRGPSDSIKILY